MMNVLEEHIRVSHVVWIMGGKGLRDIGGTISGRKRMIVKRGKNSGLS
jgi:hypothetical protein